MAISGTFSAADASVVNAGDVGIDIGSDGIFDPIESWATSAQVSGGEVSNSKESSLGGTSVTITGDKSAYVITVTSFYDEGATGPFENIWDAYAAGTYACEIRWSKDLTASSGSNVFTTSGGKITNCAPPNYDATSSAVQKFTFVITAPSIARTEA